MQGYILNGIDIDSDETRLKKLQESVKALKVG